MHFTRTQMMSTRVLIATLLVISQTWAMLPPGPGPTGDPSAASNNNPNCATVGENNSPVTGELDCGINTFSAVYAKLPPYLHYEEHRGYFGTVYDTVKSVIESCCGGDVSICMDDQMDVASRIEMGMEDSNHLAFPVAKTALTQIGCTDGYRFFPVMETTGSLVIRYAHSDQSPLHSSLVGTWPLAILVLFSASIAGIVVWILDRYWNPDDFPKSFIRGSWEGTWWAFVTMTTVGYGDKAPKSIPARVLGLTWMFVGIILMAIFTATLTAALTADTQKDFVVKGAKVGVITGTLEGLVGYRVGAEVTGYESLKVLLDAVADYKEDAALVDINMAMYSPQIMNSYKGLIADDAVLNSAVYGFILQNQTAEVEKCFAKHTSKHMFKAYEHLSSHIGRLKKSSSTVAKDTSSHILSPNPIALAVLCSVWAIAVTCCLLWEFLYYRPKLKRENKVMSASDLCLCGLGNDKDDSSNNELISKVDDTKTIHPSQNKVAPGNDTVKIAPAKDAFV